jgi:trk system potassium uptake protein TrkH
MFNTGIVFKVISRNLIIVALALVMCVGVALIYTEPLRPFILSLVSATLLGGIFHFLAIRYDNEIELGKREAYLSVTLSWFFVALAGSFPYLISGSIPYFPNAIFESVSGFTTTGSSILTDIESLPKSILFWRSLTHWIGGIGIIVLFIIVMPSLHVGGYHLFTLESSFQEKIQPRIKSVGQRLLFIYVTMTILETLLLLLGGMNLFDSVCHAFGTVATGGFSPKNISIAGYSPYIQYVIMAFMLLAGTNFIVHYYLLKRQFKKAGQNEEVKFYLLLVFAIGAIITLILFFKMGKPLETAFREAYFQVISIVTCTGYATADYLLWPQYAWLIIFLTMFLGGSTGSTAGGIKMARHLVLLKNIRLTFRELTYPKAVIPFKVNNNTINDQTNQSILTFTTTYIAIFFIGFLLLSLTGLDGQTAASSVATAMAGIGPGIGTVGPAANFAHLSDVAKILLTLLMLIGRLEIYAVIMLFAPAFWRE